MLTHTATKVKANSSGNYGRPRTSIKHVRMKAICIKGPFWLNVQKGYSQEHLSLITIF